MEPMELVAPHGGNKQPRNLLEHWCPDLLAITDYSSRSGAGVNVDGRSFLLRPRGQLALLRKFLWFDPDFGWSTFKAACLRVMPALEDMD